MNKLFKTKEPLVAEQATANKFQREMLDWIKEAVRESEMWQRQASESASTIVFTR